MKPREPEKPASPHRTRRQRVGGLFGLGLDGQDGHQRVTKGEDFFLMGGSDETHGRMQELVLRMTERLKHRGKKFADLSRSEFEDLAREVLP
jgi:hypothetical protein